MTGVTFGIVIIGSVLVLRLRPGACVGIIIVSMLIWPEYLRIPIGPALMSAPRLIALVLLIRLILMGNHRLMVKSNADRLVIFVWLYTIFSASFTLVPSEKYIWAIGYGFDTALMYFVARLAFLSQEDVKASVFPMLVTAIVMGTFGAIETATFYKVYGVFDKYKLWDAFFEKGDLFRYGFLRAKGSTNVHAYFGMAMMILTFFVWSFRSYGGALMPVALIGGIVGTMSSLTSGAWLGLIAFFVFNLFALFPRVIKPTLIFLVFVAVLLDVASNRRFYHLIDYFSLSGAAAWYRTRLLEVAINNIGDYWIVGIGTNRLHDWGPQIDGRGFVDIVNHYIIVAINGGLPAFFAFAATQVIAVRCGIRAWQASQDPAWRSVLFSLTSAVLAFNFSMLSVGLFGPALLMSFMLVGATISISGIGSESVSAHKATRPKFKSLVGEKSEAPLNPFTGLDATKSPGHSARPHQTGNNKH